MNYRFYLDVLYQNISPYLAASAEQLPEFITEALIYLFKPAVLANMLITLGLTYFIAHWLLPMIFPIPKIVDTSEKELKKKLEKANKSAIATIVGYTVLFLITGSLFVHSITKAIDELDWLRLSLLFILKMVENYLKSIPNAEVIIAAGNKLHQQLDELERTGLTEEKIAAVLPMLKPNQEGIFLNALNQLRTALQMGRDIINPKALRRL